MTESGSSDSFTVSAAVSTEALLSTNLGTVRSNYDAPVIDHRVTGSGNYAVGVGVLTVITDVRSVAVGKTGRSGYGRCVIVIGSGDEYLLFCGNDRCVSVSEVLIAGLAEPILAITVLSASSDDACEVCHRVLVSGDDYSLGLNAADVVADAAYYTVYALAKILNAYVVLAVGLACDWSAVYVPLIAYVVVVGYVQRVSSEVSAYAGYTADGERAAESSVVSVIGHIGACSRDAQRFALRVGPVVDSHAVEASGSCGCLALVDLDHAYGIVDEAAVLKLRPENEGDGVGYDSLFDNRRVGGIAGYGSEGDIPARARDNSAALIHPAVEGIALGKSEGGRFGKLALLNHGGVDSLVDYPGYGVLDLRIFAAILVVINFLDCDNDILGNGVRAVGSCNHKREAMLLRLKLSEHACGNCKCVSEFRITLVELINRNVAVLKLERGSGSRYDGDLYVSRSCEEEVVRDAVLGSDSHGFLDRAFGRLRYGGEVEGVEVVCLRLLGLVGGLNIERDDTVVAAEDAHVERNLEVSYASGSKITVELYGVDRSAHKGSDLVTLLVGLGHSAGDDVEDGACLRGDVTVVTYADKEGVALAYYDLLSERLEVSVLEGDLLGVLARLLSVDVGEVKSEGVLYVSYENGNGLGRAARDISGFAAYFDGEAVSAVVGDDEVYGLLKIVLLNLVGVEDILSIVGGDAVDSNTVGVFVVALYVLPGRSLVITKLHRDDEHAVIVKSRIEGRNVDAEVLLDELTVLRLSELHALACRVIYAHGVAPRAVFVALALGCIAAIAVIVVLVEHSHKS